MTDPRYQPRQPSDATAPSTGSAEPAETQLSAEEEPNTTGTLFLTLIILMIIGAFWVIVYGLLIGR